MKKYLPATCIVLLSLLLCTSCFDIQENISFKENGSGNFSFMMDLAQIKSMIPLFTNASVSTSKNKIGDSPLDPLHQQFETTRLRLLAIPGISDVVSIEDTTNYKFGLTFSFNDIKSLNKAMNSLYETDTTKPAPKQVVYFEMKGKRFVRNDVMDSKSILAQTTELTNTHGIKSENSLIGMDQLFAGVSYTTSYEFHNKIDSVQNANAFLSQDRKKVTIKCYPFAPVTDSTKKKCSIGNLITFK